MLHQLGVHFLYSGEALAILLLLRGLGHRRHGLPFFHGWLSVARFLAVYTIWLTVWCLLPMPYHLPLAGVFILVCMGLLFRSALRQDAPPGSPSTKAGKGAA